MDNNSNMLQLCRLCLVKDDVNIPIFEEQGDIRQIFLKISSCLPVKLSRDDRLPKKICDGCSYKLDMLYEFWNTSANAEKQLLTWLGEAGMTSQMADGTISAVAQQIKPADDFVKQETIDPPDIPSDDEDKDYVFPEKREDEKSKNNVDEPPPKRARRTAAVKAAIAMDQDSDDDDSGEPMTKIEDDSEDSDNDGHEPAFVDVPSTSADDQPGPSGVGKEGVDAPCRLSSSYLPDFLQNLNTLDVFLQKVFYCCKCADYYTLDHKCSRSNILCAFCKKSLENVDVMKHKCFRPLFKLDDSESDGGATKPRAKRKYKERKPRDKPGAKNKKRKRNYRCKDCLIKFESRNSYRKHRYQVHNEEKYKVCTLCGKSIVSLSQHLKGVHGSKDSFKCSSCDKSFSCKKHLQRHMLVHSDSYNHVCTTCGKGFKTSFSMRVHMRSHDDVKPFECPVCLKTFTTKQWRDNHLKTHSCAHFYEETNIACSVCYRHFSTATSLQHHYENLNEAYYCTRCETYVRRGSKYFPLCSCPEDARLCVFCNDKLPIPKNPRLHKCFHTSGSSDEIHIKCLICEGIFSESELEQHLLDVKQNIFYYCKNCVVFFQDVCVPDCNRRGVKSCAFCRNNVDEKQSLTHICFHQNGYPDVEALSVPCDVCNGLVYKDCLSTHRLIHDRITCTFCQVKIHNTAIVFHKAKEHSVCHLCGLKFNDFKEFLPHNRLHRLEGTSDLCDICGKTYQSPKNLRSHIRKHTSGKLVSNCKECGKPFPRKYLRRHMLVHSDEHPFICPKCGKRFKNNYNLSVHLRSHDPVKPFGCLVCEKTFTTKQWRDNHLKTHKAMLE